MKANKIMTWDGWGQTDIGRVRKVNQDAFQSHPELRLWVVADGMGGHAGGEVASRLAIETIGPFVARYQEKHRASTNHERENVLHEALEATNQSIRAYAQAHPEYTSMGTTAVVLQVSETLPSQATIAHVGDSRAYLIEENTISQLTRDHSLVEERIDLGIITREEAPNHPLRHVLTKGLGIESTIEPTVQTCPIQSTDKILLCSDGLTKMLSDEEILNVIRRYSHSLKETCQQLIDTANRLGGNDNVTVVLVGTDT